VQPAANEGDQRRLIEHEQFPSEPGADRADRASGLEDMLTYPPVPGKRTESCRDRRTTRDAGTDALPTVSSLMTMLAIKDGLTGRPTRT
jgi:hypothetical protein